MAFKLAFKTIPSFQMHWRNPEKLKSFSWVFLKHPGPFWQLKSHLGWFLGFWTGSCICREPRALHSSYHIHGRYVGHTLSWSFQAPCWQTEMLETSKASATGARCLWSGQPGEPSLPSPVAGYGIADYLQTHKAWKAVFRPEGEYWKVNQFQVCSGGKSQLKIRYSHQMFCKKMVLIKLPATSAHKPFSNTQAPAATKEEHSWPIWSIPFSTFTPYALCICSNFIRKCDKEPTSISDIQNLSSFFPDSKILIDSYDYIYWHYLIACPIRYMKGSTQ